jgi:hypothetical protein
VKTVSVDHEDYGGFSVSYLDDGGVTAEQYGYDESVEIVGTINYQLAQLSGNGFHIILGYMYYTSGGYEGYRDYTFEYNKSAKPAEVNYGGTDGYSWVNKNYPALFLAFPGSDIWSRMVALTSDDITEDMDDIIEKLTELLASKAVQDILDTLEFTDAALPVGPSNDSSKTGTFDAGYIRFTCENGWYVNDILEGSPRISGDRFYVMKEGNAIGVINISGMVDPIPKNRVDSLLASATANAKRLDNTTVGGLEYMVLEMDHNGSKDYEYFTSVGGFDENKPGTIEILIQGFTLEEARTLLETITIGDSF